MNKLITYGKQFIDKKDVIAVSKSLSDDKITTGKQVNLFENKLKKYFKSKYAAVCNSGTSALFLALLSIDIKKNDKIVMPAINFISSYNLCKFLGANVYLADVDHSTGQITPDTIIEFCKKNKISKLKAIIVMYHGGNPINAENFWKLKKKLNCFIIEDSCHALGSEYKFKKKYYKIGSCKHSDISTFSLHPLKSITTGEGGAITTNSYDIFKKIILYRSHGMKKNKKKHWDYDILLNGFNFRLNDIQCALGISQLKKINSFIKKRSLIAEKYIEIFKNNQKLKVLEPDKNYRSSHHLFMMSCENFNLKKKDSFFNYMYKNNIMLQYHYIPIYKFSFFKKKIKFKNAEKFYNTTFSLPIFYGLSDKDQNYIIDKINKYFKYKK